MELEYFVSNGIIHDEKLSTSPAQKYNVTIVIPAYNEEKRIGGFLSSLIDYCSDDVEIIVVFDGNDNTPGVVRSLGTEVKLLQYPNRLGKGRAILEGFKVAKGEVIGFVDADGAIAPPEVLRLASKVSVDTPCVIGSRWVSSSNIIKREPIKNIIASRIFHYLSFAVLGLRQKDTQCGVKFFHSSILKTFIDNIAVSGWGIDIALLYIVKSLGKPIKEVGISWTHKEYSKFSIAKAIPFMLFSIFSLRFPHSRIFENQSNIPSRYKSEMENRGSF